MKCRRCTIAFSWSTSYPSEVFTDFDRTERVRAGVGALVSKYRLPDELKPLYGSDPTSGMIFGRIKIQ